MDKRVIYTVLTGGYDPLVQPAVTRPGWDYVCFTDQPGERDGVWQLRPIPYEGSPLLKARYAKMHPGELLPEYGLSVFMDANLRITDAAFYERLEACQAPYAVLDHGARDCVWEELRYCYLKDRIGTGAALRWHRALRQMGMPRHFGLAENNVLLRRHHLEEAACLDRRWWELFLRSGAARDQLAFAPAVFSLGMSMPSWLLGPGRNARNVPFLSYSVHPPTGKENIPGRLNWANLKYNLRLLWRKAVLRVCLK